MWGVLLKSEGESYYYCFRSLFGLSAKGEGERECVCVTATPAWVGCVAFSSIIEEFGQKEMGLMCLSLDM